MRSVNTANSRTNMITVRIKIGDGAITDSASYGLIYLDSDKRVGSPIKEFESTSYPEEEGEHINPKTVDAAYDYKVKFFIQSASLKNANDRIKEFNALLYTRTQGSDVKTFKQVEFYNDYKRHKIVGYPQPISEATEFWRDRKNQVSDVVIVEWTIRVNKPSLCDYDLLYNTATGTAQLSAGNYKITGSYTTLSFTIGDTTTTITPGSGGVFTVASAGVLTVTGGNATTNITVNS